MAILQVARFAVSLSARLPDQAFNEIFPSSVSALGKKIAGQVIAYEKQSNLGYFPAINYFRDNPNIIDDYLLDALEQVAEVAVRIATLKTYQLLQPVFSQVMILTQQNMVYGMPHVRPRNDDHEKLLALHYAPNQVKLGMELSLLQKTTPQKELAGAVKKMVLRWLSDTFDDIEVNDVRLLGPPS